MYRHVTEFRPTTELMQTPAQRRRAEAQADLMAANIAAANLAAAGVSPPTQGVGVGVGVEQKPGINPVNLIGGMFGVCDRFLRFFFCFHIPTSALRSSNRYDGGEHCRDEPLVLVWDRNRESIL